MQCERLMFQRLEVSGVFESETRICGIGESSQRARASLRGIGEPRQRLHMLGKENILFDHDEILF